MARKRLLVKHQPLPAEPEDGNLFLQVNQAQDAAEGLAQHRREGGAFRAHAQPGHQHQVAQHVQHRADHEEDQRTGAVADGPEDAGEAVIHKGKDQTHEDDPHIGNGQIPDGFLHLHQGEEGMGEENEHHGDRQGEAQAAQHRGADLAAEGFIILRAVMIADQDAGAQGDAVEKENHQGHQRIGGAHSGQRLLADIAADDDAVHGVVEQLKQVPQHEGNRKPDQLRGHLAFGKIRRHAPAILSGISAYSTSPARGSQRKRKRFHTTKKSLSGCARVVSYPLVFLLFG